MKRLWVFGLVVIALLASAPANATVPGNWVPRKNAAAAVHASGGGKNPNLIGWGGATYYIGDYQLLVGNNYTLGHGDVLHAAQRC